MRVGAERVGRDDHQEPPGARPIDHSVEESDRVDNVLEFSAILRRCRGQITGVHDEALAIHVQDPNPIHLSGKLLVAVARPAVGRPALEGGLVAVREEARASRALSKSMSVGTDHSRYLPRKPASSTSMGAVALRSGCFARAVARPSTPRPGSIIGLPAQSHGVG